MRAGSTRSGSSRASAADRPSLLDGVCIKGGGKGLRRAVSILLRLTASRMTVRLDHSGLSARSIDALKTCSADL